MTAKTSQTLADALRSAGFEDLAKQAETDTFHDFLSPHTFAEMVLDNELVQIITAKSRPEHERKAAHDIRQRLHKGEFDASRQESDVWADSEDGRAAFAMLARGK